MSEGGGCKHHRHVSCKFRPRVSAEACGMVFEESVGKACRRLFCHERQYNHDFLLIIWFFLKISEIQGNTSPPQVKFSFVPIVICWFWDERLSNVWGLVKSWRWRDKMGEASSQFLLFNSLCKCSDCSLYCIGNDIPDLLCVILFGGRLWLVWVVHSLYSWNEF